jgi:hypothetical protein
MELIRSELLNILKRVSPALGDDKQKLIPVLSHLCFDGESVVAYDNCVALRSPCSLGGFIGALPGGLLLSMLGSHAIDKMSLEPCDGGVMLKIGRMTLRLASLSDSSFLFRRPVLDGAVRIAVTNELLGMFRLLLRSVSSSKTDSGFMLGVTIDFGVKYMFMYATDSRAVVRCRLPMVVPELLNKPLQLTERFVELLQRLARQGDEMLITSGGDVVVRIADGVELFGRVIQDTKPEQYESVLTASKFDTLDRPELPVTLSRCIDRAGLVDADNIRLTYDSGSLEVYSKGPCGELQDSVKVDMGANGRVSVWTHPGCLGRYLDVAKYVGMSDHSVVLQTTGVLVLVAVAAGPIAAGGEVRKESL